MLNLYGILISFGILSGLYVGEKLTKDKDTLWGLAFVSLIWGIIGARLYHVIDYWNYYSQDLKQILFIWNGGLGIWGGVFFGIVAQIFYLKKRGKNILKWLDLSAVLIPLAQSIGRWGNFFNQELFGLPTDKFIGIFINYENRPEKYRVYSKFHPLFLYESVLNLILFIILFKLYKNERLKDGSYLKLYLAGYSLIRFSLEFLRIDPWTIHGLNVAQWISILMLLIIGVSFLKKPKFEKSKI